jgi:hypothetical protein
VAVELIKLLGFSAVLLPLAVAVVRLAVHTNRHRGTLIEY